MRLQQSMGDLFHNRLVTARTDIPRRTDIDAPVPYRQNKHILFGQQEGRCNGCRSEFPFRILEVDHVIPQRVGGQDNIENLQLLCAHCNRDAVPSSRFCEECESLAAGPTAQAQPQQQAVPVEVAAETLSKRQTEAVELLARRPDLSQSVRELLERVSLRMVGETPPLLSEDMPAVVANDPESVLDVLLGATDATAFARVLEAQREAIEDQDAMDLSPEGHDERL